MERDKVVIGIIFALVLTIGNLKTTAQELIFEKQPGQLPDHPNFGPNRVHFYHTFLSTSLTFPTSQISTIHTKQPITGQVSLGFRYKYKIAKPLAIVTECGASSSHFKIEQAPGKNFPDTSMHRSQVIRASGLFGGASLRIRLGQSGDYLGNYVDLGITVQAFIMNDLLTKDFDYSANPIPYRTKKTTISGFKEINPFTYKASVRFGFDRLSLFASYRLSRLLKTTSQKDLPGLEFGLEISPVRY